MRALPSLLVILAAGCSSTPAALDASPDRSRDLVAADASARDARAELALADRGSDGAAGCPAFAAAAKAGSLAAPEIDEASGLIASRKNAGVLWAHNDSGDKPRLFAFTPEGTHLGIYTLAGAKAEDWEDMASGPGPTAGAQYLYLGDIGDNAKARPNVTVYRVLEPTVSASQAPADVTLTGVEALVFTYPDGAQNAETLLVDPVSGDLAIVSKDASGTSKVYWSAAPQDATAPRALTVVATLELGKGALAHLGALSTGGDVSPDGSELIVRGYVGAALFRRPAGSPLHQAFASPPCKVPLAVELQGEALSFAAQGGGYYTVSEGKNPPLYVFARK